jgi:hypothetical protein
MQSLPEWRIRDHINAGKTQLLTDNRQRCKWVWGNLHDREWWIRDESARWFEGSVGLGASGCSTVVVGMVKRGIGVASF